MLTTSWPSAGAPWAGHFVADLARELARRRPVTVVAPAWAGLGGLLGRRGVRVVSARLPGAPGSLAARPGWAAAALTALGGAARRAAQLTEAPAGGPRRARWLAHWWPTAWAAPPGAEITTVLHGSDVDLLERLPRALARRALRPGRLVAVAPHLLRRARDAVGAHGWREDTAVCALGADRAPARRPLGGAAGRWAADARPRVLTVGRAAPGKGLEVARAAARRLPGVAWLVLDGRPAVAPGVVRAAMRWADLCVVPSQRGPGLPHEGRPHVIAQALVAGVPVVGGPNEAVAQAVEHAGQLGVRGSRPEDLAAVVARALEPSTHASLRRAAAAAGRDLAWAAVLPAWEAALR